MFFEQYYVEPVIGSLRFWTMTGKLGEYAAMVEGRRQTAARALSALQRALSTASFLAGSSFTIADLAVYAYSHRAEDADILLTGYPAVRTWFDRVANAIGPGYPVHPYSIDPHSA